MQLDQWATTLHTKIDQIHNELQLALDHFDKKIQEKSDQLKTYLTTHLEQNVGFILTEQLQKVEINKPQVEKATLEYHRLENLFHSFHNRPLITMAIDTENQKALNPPTIICSDILTDGLNLNENIQEKIDWSDQQENSLSGNSTCETRSCKYIHDFYFQKF
jgi:hypothetical protein